MTTHSAETFNYPDNTPCLTAHLPGIGGTIRSFVDDFEVEEIPAYQPSGAGGHLYLWIEKRGCNTRDVARELSRFAGIAERDVGIAGQKDKHALTRQFFSIPASSRFPEEGNGWRVLSSGLHSNKLKTGHLQGNRFRIQIRQVADDALDKATAIAEILRRQGLPNFFGPQRFGQNNSNALLGRKLLLGLLTPEVMKAKRDRFVRRMIICAYQSLLFNRVLCERMKDGLFHQAILGDLMKKHETGGLFISSNPEIDHPRIEQFEISPTGPIFGHRMMTPENEALHREQKILNEENLTLDSFASLKGEAEGTRRLLRVPVDITIQPNGESLSLSFSLPKGSFATVVLKEIMKTDGFPPIPEHE